jgi:hypothetical protein
MAPTPQPDTAALPSHEVRICLQQPANKTKPIR